MNLTFHFCFLLKKKKNWLPEKLTVDAAVAFMFVWLV